MKNRTFASIAAIALSVFSIFALDGVASLVVCGVVFFLSCVVLVCSIEK